MTPYHPVPVYGNSMDRTGITDGMWVRVRQTPVAYSGQIVAVLEDGGGVIIKRLRRARDGRWWLHPESTDTRHHPRPAREGDRVLGVVVDLPERPRRHLVEPPYVVPGSWIPQPPPRMLVVGQAGAPGPAPDLPPAPAPVPPPDAGRPRLPRLAPTANRVPLTYGGLVGAGLPLAHEDGGKILVSRESTEHVHFCVFQASGSLAGIGIQPGDLLFARGAYSYSRRCGLLRDWEIGHIVIASVDGQAFAGELLREGGQLRVRSRTGAVEEAETIVTPGQLDGIVLHAEAPGS